jgi:hypothetical protein
MGPENGVGSGGGKEEADVKALTEADREGEGNKR